MSDWSATMSTLSAVAGLDMTMPGDITFDSGTSYFGGNLTAFVNNGTIPSSRVDDMATRILAAWYLLGQDAASYPQPNFSAFFPDDEATNHRVDVQHDHHKIVRAMGSASVVLLKNERRALPLRRPRSLVIIGNDAGPGMAGPNQFVDQGGSDGALAMGWGSGCVMTAQGFKSIIRLTSGLICFLQDREFHVSYNSKPSTKHLTRL